MSKGDSATDSAPDNKTVFDALLEALAEAQQFNANELVAPAAILWTDKSGVWGEVVTRLRGELPVLTLGDYAPSELTGPAIWLRCVLADKLDVGLTEGISIIYLPGVSRQALRAVEDCADALKPIVELQYRGVFFTQVNARDWTPSAFLQARVGAKVAEDKGTKEALARALSVVLDELVADLKNRGVLSAPFFNALLTPDPVKDMLAWLNGASETATAGGATVGGAMTEGVTAGGATWDAFRDTCRKEFKLDPVKDGAVSAAQRLGEGQGKWAEVWARYKEAPQRYPKLPGLLRRAKPTQATLFEASEAWPQDNEAEEGRLAEALTKLPGLTLGEAREKVKKLEAEHAHRREWVWAMLGETRLADTLPTLLELSELSATPLGSGSPAELAERYTSGAWRIDALALSLMGAGKTQVQTLALHAALGSFYKPWLETSATTFQNAVKTQGWAKPESLAVPGASEVLLFCDGLRFDVGMLLKEKLKEHDLRVDASHRLGALPGVTSTAKPAVSPVGTDLEPADKFDVAHKGTRVTINVLRRLLGDKDVQVLQGRDTGRVNGKAWTEHGDLDNLGHSQGWKLSQRLDSELQSLFERVNELLEAGWKKVTILTDHGWLLLPSKLEKAELSVHLADYRKGRCARLKPDVQTDYQCAAWHYDEGVDVALAPGISAFEAGKEYEHGGLSVQESVLPLLTVWAGTSTVSSTVAITELNWAGLRCRLTVSDAPPDAIADLRGKANDAATSVAGSLKAVAADGTCSLVVPDDSKEGEAVHLVILDAAGNVLTQQTTTVGG